jgi:very-short-patch-repair endonuclease
MSDKVAPIDRRLAILAARQHGLVTTAQAVAAGVDKHAVTYRLRAGRLHRIHRGVYAVGHARLTFEGRCLAAALACGDRPPTSKGLPFIAAVSHRAAAALWRLLPPAAGPIDVSLTTRSGRKQRDGIAIHRPPSLSPDAITRTNAIPVTRPLRTIQDLRRVVPPKLVQRATRRALDLKLLSEDQLRNDEELTRSELEVFFLRLCRRHRLPPPEVNARVERYEVDFFWPSRQLIVETDGWEHHSNRLAFERDRERDAELQGMGYRVLRFTYRRVIDAPGEVASALRAVLLAGGAR